MNVLIVEDDPIISKSLSMALSDEGHFSDICGTAEDGLIAATDHCYDAIILDINLPDSDGIRLSKTFVAVRLKHRFLLFPAEPQQLIRW